MKTIAVHSPIGGSGKTTIARALHQAKGYGYQSIDPLYPEVTGSTDVGLVIDCSPHWEPEIEQAVGAADVLLVPLKSIPEWMWPDLTRRLLQVLAVRENKQTIIFRTDPAKDFAGFYKRLQSIKRPGVHLITEIVDVRAGQWDAAQLAKLALD